MRSKWRVLVCVVEHYLITTCLVEGLPNFSCGPDGFKFRKKIMFGRPTKLRKALLCLASDLTYHTESGKWWPKTCPSPNPLSSLWLCISVSISIPLLSFPSPTCGAARLLIYCFLMSPTARRELRSKDLAKSAASWIKRGVEFLQRLFICVASDRENILVNLISAATCDIQR